MMKKIISTFLIGLILSTCITVPAYAIENEEFLKFLINSSYPEANKENKTDRSNEEKIDKKEQSNKDDDFIKMHIGEENQPTIENNATKDGNSNSSSIKINSKLKGNEEYLTSKDPKVLIYHTHSSETYVGSPDGNYHSQNINQSVMAAGRVLTEELEKRGISVLHNTTYHDYPVYNGSYTRSLPTAKAMLEKYNNIDIVIDLHRDATLELTSQEIINSQNKKYTTTINGEKVAKFFFVVGQKSPNASKVRSLAQDITNLAESKYPGITRPIVEKDYAKFNQYLSDDYMLIEIGSNAVSIEEAKKSAVYLAEILDEYYKTKGK